MRENFGKLLDLGISYFYNLEVALGTIEQMNAIQIMNYRIF